MTRDNIVYAVFPGPIRDMLVWAAASSIVAPCCEQDYMAAQALAASGILEYDANMRVYRVPNTWAVEWLQHAKQPASAH